MTQSKAAHLLKGEKAERLAEVVVKKAGLRVLDKNFRTRFGELDLVCRTAKELIFIEVRFRSNKSFGSAVESVTLSKQRKLTKAAQQYISINHQLSKLIMRFDVIGIEADDQIQWIEGAFLATV